MTSRATGGGDAVAPRRFKRVVLWLRRDLRLDDNPALAAALEMAEEVVSVPGAACTRV